MYKIFKECYVKVRREWKIDLDEKNVERINKDLQRWCAETLPVLTEQNIVDIVNQDVQAEDFFETEYEWKIEPYGEKTYKTTIADFLNDLLEEELDYAEYEEEDVTDPYDCTEMEAERVREQSIFDWR